MTIDEFNDAYSLNKEEIKYRNEKGEIISTYINSAGETLPVKLRWPAEELPNGEAVVYLTGNYNAVPLKNLIL